MDGKSGRTYSFPLRRREDERKVFQAECGEIPIKVDPEKPRRARQRGLGVGGTV